LRSGQVGHGGCQGPCRNLVSGDLKDAGRPVLEKPFATEAALAQIAKILGQKQQIRVTG